MPMSFIVDSRYDEGGCLKSKKRGGGYMDINKVKIEGDKYSSLDMLQD